MNPKQSKRKAEFTSEETGIKAICDLCGYNLDHHNADYKCFNGPKPSYAVEATASHTPTPWRVERKPLSNVAMNNDKDTFRIMEGDTVIASVPRSWKIPPTNEDLSYGSEPQDTRSAKQAELLANKIADSVNTIKRVKLALNEAEKIYSNDLAGLHVVKMLWEAITREGL